MNPKGYTLVELIVVICLVGMMLFLAIPSMRTIFLSDPLPSTVKQIAGMARELRTDAVREQIDFILNFDLNRNSFWSSSADMTPEKKDESRTKAFTVPEGIKIKDIYHVGEAKKNDGEMQVLFYKNGVVQPTVIHLHNDQKTMTIIFEPFLNNIRIFDRYVEYPGDEDKG